MIDSKTITTNSWVKVNNVLHDFWIVRDNVRRLVVADTWSSIDWRYNILKAVEIISDNYAFDSNWLDFRWNQQLTNIDKMFDWIDMNPLYELLKTKFNTIQLYINK